MHVAQLVERHGEQPANRQRRATRLAERDRRDPSLRTQGGQLSLRAGTHCHDGACCGFTEQERGRIGRQCDRAAGPPGQA